MKTRLYHETLFSQPHNISLGDAHLSLFGGGFGDEEVAWVKVGNEWRLIQADSIHGDQKKIHALILNCVNLAEEAELLIEERVFDARRNVS